MEKGRKITRNKRSIEIRRRKRGRRSKEGDEEKADE